MRCTKGSYLSIRAHVYQYYQNVIKEAPVTIFTATCWKEKNRIVYRIRAYRMMRDIDEIISSSPRPVTSATRLCASRV